MKCIFTMVFGIFASFPNICTDHSFQYSCYSPCSDPVVKDYDFSESGWNKGFADYPSGQEVSYELQGMPGRRYQDIKGNERRGYMLSGINHSDDLFMFVTTHIKTEELNEHTQYSVKFSIEFASNISSKDCVGIGGSPSAVTVKAGLTTEKPVASGEYMQLNIDKGNQTRGGKDIVLLGDIGSDDIDTCGYSNTYAIIARNNQENPFYVTTGKRKLLWLMLGFDSGFEGKTTLYLNRIKVELTPLDNQKCNFIIVKNAPTKR